MAGEGSGTLHFHCRGCGSRFEAVPTRVTDLPEREWQPHDYFSDCRDCGSEAAQADWERNLAKAHANATGPKTPEGKAASSANLVGHPTPEEARRTRFNAMKSGLFAKTAAYWPAKPGKYPHCATCEHLNNGCNIYQPPGHKNPPACLKRTELFMRYQIAFETRDPKMLSDNVATLQALAWQLVNDMFLAVIQDGERSITPEWHFDKDGVLHIAQYTDGDGNVRTIERIRAHPLLPFIIDFMNKNGMTLPDSGMTMKVKDEEETVMGFLDQSAKAVEQDGEFRERQTKALEGLAGLIERSKSRQTRDPVLIEHQRLEKGDDHA